MIRGARAEIRGAPSPRAAALPTVASFDTPVDLAYGQVGLTVAVLAASRPPSRGRQAQENLIHLSARHNQARPGSDVQPGR